MNNTTTQQDREVLLNKSRRDAYQWIGMNGAALAAVAYATSVSGGTFETLSVNVLIRAADRFKAPDRFEEMRNGAPDDAWSDELFYCVTARRDLHPATFRLSFFVNRED